MASLVPDSAVAADHLHPVDVVLLDDLQVVSEQVHVGSGLVVHLPVDGPAGGVLDVGLDESLDLLDLLVGEGSDLDTGVDVGPLCDDLCDPLSYTFDALETDDGPLLTVDIGVDDTDDEVEVLVLGLLRLFLSFSHCSFLRK